MQQLIGLPEQFHTFDSPIYTDGSDIDLPGYEYIEKQIIPGTRLFDGKYFLHGRTPNGKYIKGTLWEKSLVDKMESDLRWFRAHGANIPQFETIEVQVSGKPYQLIVSDYIPDLDTFEVFKKYNNENLETGIREVVRFANIHLDYLELSIAQGLPVLFDIHLRQLHLNSAGQVYMLDLEPRYSKDGVSALLNETQKYKSFAAEHRDQSPANSSEIELFLTRCERLLEEYQRT